MKRKLIALILIIFVLSLSGCEAIDGVISTLNSTDGSVEDVLPEDNQPEGNQPEGNQPEGNQPEGNQPEGNQPEGNQPENNQPEGNQPEGNQPTHVHSYVATVTAPTCVSDGYITYSCSGCNDSYVANPMPAFGHVERIVEGTDATCTESGLTRGVKCSICGEMITAQSEIPATGHSYASKVTKPTCTAEGYTTYTCSCGDSYVSDKTDALGHTEKTVAGKAATCTESGLTDGVICSVCTIVITEQHSIPATGHTDVAPTDFICDVCSTDLCTEHVAKKISGTAPTCTKNGFSDGAICSVCGEILTAQTEIPAVGHNYNSSVTAPTCDADGYTTYTCTVCTHSYTADVVTKTGHSYNSTVTAPTCDADGYTTYTCTVCAHSYTADVVTKTGHNYNSTVTAPTCTAAGYITYTCKTCQSTLSEKTEIAPTGHS